MWGQERVRLLFQAEVLGGRGGPFSGNWTHLIGRGAGWVGVVGAPMMSKPCTMPTADGSRIGWLVEALVPLTETTGALRSVKRAVLLAHPANAATSPVTMLVAEALLATMFVEE